MHFSPILTLKAVLSWKKCYLGAFKGFQSQNFKGSVDVLTKIQVTLTSSSKLLSLTFTDVDFDDSASGSIKVDRIFSQCSSCLTLELTS